MSAPTITPGVNKDLLGQPVLTAENVSITYEVDPPVHAVKNVSLTLKRGEILGLAGESGCGKTTLAYGMNRLLKAPANFRNGKVTFHDESGEDIVVSDLSGEALRSFRWDKIRSEEHTSELQSRGHLVCRLLLEKKKKTTTKRTIYEKYKCNSR